MRPAARARILSIFNQKEAAVEAPRSGGRPSAWDNPAAGKGRLLPGAVIGSPACTATPSWRDSGYQDLSASFWSQILISGIAKGNQAGSGKKTPPSGFSFAPPLGN
ncbi:hypothetical protein [Ruegeria marina]|uniref:hypothetical protein n=1 Tax=Ruegeria marina TaxID=639004 RepID=UPI00115FC975|nr:hypothetical protein [Ruegeria marina]